MFLKNVKPIPVQDILQVQQLGLKIGTLKVLTSLILCFLTLNLTSYYKKFEFDRIVKTFYISHIQTTTRCCTIIQIFFANHLFLFIAII
jgi:hypothetical protein